MKKTVYIGLTILVIGLYLIHSYNTHLGHSYIYEPIFISIKTDLPQNSRLDIQYTTINDPVTPQKAHLLINNAADNDTYIFKIDSSYRIKGFRLFLLSFPEKESTIISEIRAFNMDGVEFNFSLNSKDLIAPANLKLEDLNTQGIRIKRIAQQNSPTSSLYFEMRGSFNMLFTSSGIRVPDIPSLFASIIILILIFLMAFILYPLLRNIKLKGISPGAYILALVIFILPTGEKVVNLLLIISIGTGLILNLKRKSLRSSFTNNKLLLFLTLFSIVIYTVSFLISPKEAYSQSIFFLKLGFPMILLSLIFNIRDEKEIRLQYASLIAGVIVSIFIHFGWIVIFTDSVELKSKLISKPLYYLESSIFTRVHHSYLSVLYLVSLTILLFTKQIVIIGTKHRIIFSILICVTMLLAFSRAAILSLILLLIFHALKKLVNLVNFEITPLVRISSFVILTITLLTFVISDFRFDTSPENNIATSLHLRINLWENASEIIKQKPLTGWGPNGYIKELSERNKLNINFSSFDTNLNTHNQFLATSGMFGVVIGIGLLLFLIFPTGFSKKNTINPGLIFTIAIIFITSFLFESFLNRNLGILIFGLVYGLLIKLNSIPPMNHKNHFS